MTNIMRRTSICLVILALLSVLALAFTSCGKEVPGTTVSFKYTETDDNVQITGYEGVIAEGTKLTIPANVNNKPVTSIAAYAFAECDGIVEVFIPASVNAIGEGAFESCENLTAVNIPYGVKSIAARTFYGCKSLTGISLTKKITSIGEKAFYGCKSLESLTIPSSVTEIGDAAFKKCKIKNADITTWAIDAIDTDALESLVITGGTAIGEKTFYKCKSLVSVYIPAEVNEIAENAFAECDSIEHLTAPGWSLDRFSLSNLKTLNIIGNAEIAKGMLKDCTSLERLTLPCIGSTASATYTHFGFVFGAQDASANPNVVPKSLKSVVITGGDTVGKEAFFGCSGITDIILPSTVTSIGEGAFKGCDSLTSVNIPARVSTIGAEAFAQTNIESAIIPNSMTKIEEKVFYNCKNLSTLSIGTGVVEIGTDAFSGCDGLTALYIGDIEKWCALDFADYYSNPLFYARNLYVDGELIERLVIPKSVTAIKNNSFFGCANVKSIEFEGELTAIGDYAFTSAVMLESIMLPDTVKSVGRSAFANCEALKELTIPSSLESIGAYAFNLCSELESVKILGTPAISEGAFRSCSSLTALEVLGAGEVSENAFEGCDNVALISAPYSVARIISANALVSLTVTDADAIESDAFMNATRLESVTLCDSVVSIGANAFSGCISLKAITLGQSSVLESIGARAFADCYKLMSITVPENVSAIESDAFEDCYRLAEVYNLSEIAIEEILPYELAVYTSLDTESKYTMNGDFLFFEDVLIGYYGNNTVLSLPVGFEYRINANALRALDITGLVIPASVTEIGEGAFADCGSLTELTAPIAALAHVDASTVTVLTLTDTASITKGALDGFTKLKTLVIPETTSQIASGALTALVSIESITLQGNNAAFKLIDGNLYTADGKKVIRVMTTVDYYTLPATVTAIGDGAFAGCKSISISYEDETKLQSIGAEAFKGCDGIYSFEIKANVTSIGEGAFDGCTSIYQITVQEGNTVFSVTEDGKLVDKNGKVYWEKPAEVQ